MSETATIKIEHKGESYKIKVEPYPDESLNYQYVCISNACGGINSTMTDADISENEVINTARVLIEQYLKCRI